MRRRRRERMSREARLRLAAPTAPNDQWCLDFVEDVRRSRGQVLGNLPAAGSLASAFGDRGPRAEEQVLSYAGVRNPRDRIVPSLGVTNAYP